MGTGHGRGRLDFPVIPRKQESSAPADACRVRCRAAGRDLDPYFRRGDGGLGSRRNPVRLRAGARLLELESLCCSANPAFSSYPGVLV